MNECARMCETKRFHARKGGRIENVRGTTNDVVAHTLPSEIVRTVLVIAIENHC